jgi:hypothetical protein
MCVYKRARAVWMFICDLKVLFSLYWFILSFTTIAVNDQILKWERQQQFGPAALSFFFDNYIVELIFWWPMFSSRTRRRSKNRETLQSYSVSYVCMCVCSTGLRREWIIKAWLIKLIDKDICIYSYRSS